MMNKENFVYKHPAFYILVMLPGIIFILCIPLASIIGMWFGFNDNISLLSKILTTYAFICSYIDYFLLIKYLRKIKKEREDKKNG